MAEQQGQEFTHEAMDAARRGGSVGAAADLIVSRAQALGLGRVAYERFAELRIAASPSKALYMPPWDDAPSFGGVGGASGLPDSEKEIWAQVALAVRTYIPFVITDEVMDAMIPPPDYKYDQRTALRAAATAAGFRVIEQ